MKYRECKKCEGFYSIDDKIESSVQLRDIGEKILSANKTCYHPIILLTPDFPYFKKTRKENLRSLPGVYTISNGWKEKGVDVKIVVDMLNFSRNGTCDSIILVSSDSDLLPVIEKVQSVGKTVEYVGFAEGYYSTALLNKCDARKLLTRQEIEQYLPKTLF